MKKKKNLWQGLAYVCAMSLTFVSSVSIVLETFSKTIDTALNTRSEIIVSDDDGTLYSTFKPKSEFLNADGTGNSKAVIKGAMDLSRREAAEGSVLLKNENKALPLASKSKVTLLGLRSYKTLLGSSFGVKVQGPVISLADALSKNKTDFHNPDNAGTSGDYSEMDDFDFEGAGFEVNPVMNEVYKKCNETVGAGYNDGLPRGGSAWSPSALPFDSKEPSLADLESANASYKDSFSQYHDAAIVVVGRPGNEATDYTPGFVDPAMGCAEPLQLSTNEKEMIKLATDNFDKVIVLVNCTSAMEIGELKNNPKISSIMWIGFPGAYGTLGVADILSGKANPSGGLTDVYATNNLSAPAMMNMGDFTFANAADITRSVSKKYIVEAEGIYTGYRYYETRYNDCVLNQGNANSNVGTYASTGNWNYNEEMTYTFGYGLSYTTFNQKITGATVHAEPHEILMDVNVEVENKGDVAGRTPIQIYAQAPYTQGGIEKSAIQLVAFDKTKVLQPGEKETYKVTVDMQNLCSYDMNHKNADGTTGTYILDAGNYYFSVGNGAHEALNNILAKQGKTPANTDNRMDAAGNEEAVYQWNYKYAGGAVDNNTFSVTINGTQVSNQLPYSDWNYYEKDKVTYLSRSNWSGTYPKKYENMSVPASMMDDINGKYYTLKTTDDTSDIKWNSKETEHKLYQMVGSEYDDYRWDELLDQISVEESMTMAGYGGPILPSMASIGFEEDYLTENCGNGMVLTFEGTKDPNAPWTVSDNNKKWNPQVFCCAPLVASSFDHELFKELGEFVANEALFTGLPILWGPGLNTHRHAYNGRNCEYYSEDPILSGEVAMEYAIGARDYGLIAAPKHFAFNDQETNRNGVAPFMTEQRAREIDLRAYQIPVEAKKYDKLRNEDTGMIGLMTSFSKIGAVECTASRGLITDILKEEWGFHGYAVTDIYDDTDLYSAVVYAGVTGYDIRGASGFYDKTTIETRFGTQADGNGIKVGIYDHDATMQKALKESNHNILWALSQSNLMNRYNASTHKVWQMTWWRGVYIGAISVFGAATALAIGMYIASSVKSKEEE